MNQHCHSCGMPLSNEAKGNYCTYCTDEKGNLHPREAVRQGIAQWLQGFSPQKEGVDFLHRADCYLQAMPAWADSK